MTDLLKLFEKQREQLEDKSEFERDDFRLFYFDCISILENVKSGKNLDLISIERSKIDELNDLQYNGMLGIFPSFSKKTI